MKRIIFACLVIVLSFVVFGCGEKKILHCDNCQIEVKVDSSSNMEEDWIIYCEECNKELFGEDGLLGEYK